MQKKIRFDKDWKFVTDRDCGVFSAYGFRKCSSATGPADIDYHEGMMRNVDLPHDWGIELLPDARANPSNACRPISRYIPQASAFDCDSHTDSVSVGWYRKHFKVEKLCDNQRVFLEFEGVFRDYAVFVNGIYIDKHNSGYTSAVFDITDQLIYTKDNVVAIRVHATQPEGWWYEGAGIYGHAHLIIKSEVYVPQYSTFIVSQNTGSVKVSTVLRNSSCLQKSVRLECRISDCGRLSAEPKSITATLLPSQALNCSFDFHIESPKLWDTESPYLYTAEFFIDDDEAADDSQRFGFREFTYDADRGMFLNGKPIKIRGACIHQDFGGFGVALPESISRYKIELLKSMGVNAYRASHHPASPDILNICDELGVLVLDETRVFGSSPEALRQLDDMVTQHRNHPCVFMWSLGNEEYHRQIQSTDRAAQMARTAYERIKALDPTRAITFGSNNGCVDKGVNSVVDVRGFNYIRNLERLTRDAKGNHIPGYNADRYHAEHPDRIMLGTEEGSHFLCRDAGFDNFEKGQVNATGEHTAMGGSTPEGWVKFYESRDYLMGGFMWTGIDYYGEPKPFTQVNTSSSFGAIDLVGFPKNSYYYYRSCWLDEPILEIMPHWDFKKGDRIKIAVYTNCEFVSLYLNGKKLGEKQMEKYDSAIWEIDFEPGCLEAVGERNGATYRTCISTPNAPKKLSLTADKTHIDTDGIVIVDAMITDESGNICRQSDREIQFETEGNGKIIAIGNGNPADRSADKFLESVETRDINGFYVSRDGAPKEKYAIPHENDISGVTKSQSIDSQFKSVLFEPKHPDYEDSHRLVWQYQSPNEKTTSAIFEAEIADAEGFEFIQFDRLFGKFEVYLNGTLIGKNTAHLHVTTPYRFYCQFKNGANHLEVRMSGVNTAQLGIYNRVAIGKTVKPIWKKESFYGKLRVFVQAKDSGSFTLLAKSNGLDSKEVYVNVTEKNEKSGT